MKKLTFHLLLILSLQSFSQSDSIVVHFDNNSSYLNAIEKERIIIKNYKQIKIHAYCDYLGSNEYNLWLSQRRANRVKEIILKNGIDSNLIIESIGKGEIGLQQNNKLGIASNRKVVIFYSEVEKIIESETNFKIPETVINKLVVLPEIDSIEIGEEINLPKLSFIGGRHELSGNSNQGIEQLIYLLKKNPNLKIAIEGHICCETKFDDGYDQQTGLYNLSTARAKTVFEILVKEGIDSTRLTYAGFGRTMPLYPLEKDEFEQQANRRVEFKLIEK